MTQAMADFLEIFTDTSKTTIMFLLLIVAIALRVDNYIDGSGFVSLMQTTTVAYFGTTTLVHFTTMIKDHLEAKLSTPVPAEEKKS